MGAHQLCNISIYFMDTYTLWLAHTSVTPYNIDVSLGMKSTNYWIKDTMNTSPEGIATLGRNDNVNAGNSLTDSMVRVGSRNGSAKTFILTFNQSISRGAEYMLIICYVTLKEHLLTVEIMEWLLLSVNSKYLINIKSINRKFIK